MNQLNKKHSLLVLSMIGAFAVSGATLANEKDWQQMDTNQDGMLSAQEHASHASSKFEEIDTDGDGRITAADMQAAHAQMGGDRGHGKSPAEKFDKMDSDGDGTVTAQEHAAMAQEKFAKLDDDNDGSVSQDDYEAKKDKDRDHDMDRMDHDAMDRGQGTDRRDDM